MRIARPLFIAIIVAASTALTSCDPEHKKKCEWYLMPDVDGKDDPADNFIPMCARNFAINKQDCRMQATVEVARTLYNKKFRYVDLKYADKGFPRTITGAPTCE